MTKEQEKKSEYTLYAIAGIIFLMCVLLDSSGCGKHKKKGAIVTHAGQDISVGIDYPTISDALQHTQVGDTVWASRSSVAYSTKSGERFPLIFPVAGVKLKAAYGGAAPYAIIDMDSPNQLSVFEVNNGVRIEGFQIKSSTKKAPQLASLQGLSDVAFIDCNIQIPGIVGQGLVRLTVHGCSFFPLYGFPAQAIGVFFSSDVVASGNTIINSKIVFSDSVRVTIEENIIVDGEYGIQIDDNSLPSTSIQYNDVWRNNRTGPTFDYYNTTTAATFTPSGVGNISVYPGFVRYPSSDEFSILASSPATTAGKNGRPIGAGPVIGELHLTLHTASPSSIAKAPKTEVMRFTMTAMMGKDIEFGLGSSITFETFSLSHDTRVAVEIVDAVSGKTLFDGNAWQVTSQPPIYQIMMTASVSHTIVAGTSRDYKVLMNTSGFGPPGGMSVGVENPFSSAGEIKVYANTARGVWNNNIIF